MSVKATYALYVDWNNDGDYSDAGEDVSGVLIGANVERGLSSDVARMATVGRARFVLNNVTQAYSPPLAATVLPRRPVRFTMTYDGTTETLFEGYLESITPAPGTKGSRTVILDCVDAIALLDHYEGPIALQTGVYADDVIDAAVSAVYTPGSTDYDAGINYFPYGADRWQPPVRFANSRTSSVVQTFDESASSKILAACTADWGIFFVSKSGVPTYRNRHTLSLDSSAALTLDNTMSGLDYSKGAGSVYNDVQVTCHPRTVGQTYEVLGRISQQDAPRIEAGGSETFEMDFRDPSNPSLTLGGKDVIAPVVTTDYEATDDEAGEGNDVSPDVSATATIYGDHAEVTLSNALANPVWIQKLQIRGLAVRVRETVTMRASDATSIDDYERRVLPINAVLMSSPIHAQNLADHLLARYKDPIDLVETVQFWANNSATFMAAARDLDLCDRVEVTEDQTGLSGHAGYIRHISHRITAARIHSVSLSLATAYSIGGTAFTIGTSELGGTDIFIY